MHTLFDALLVVCVHFQVGASLSAAERSFLILPSPTFSMEASQGRKTRNMSGGLKDLKSRQDIKLTNTFCVNLALSCSRCATNTCCIVYQRPAAGNQNVFIDAWDDCLENQARKKGLGTSPQTSAHQCVSHVCGNCAEVHNSQIPATASTLDKLCVLVLVWVVLCLLHPRLAVCMLSVLQLLTVVYCASVGSRNPRQDGDQIELPWSDEDSVEAKVFNKESVVHCELLLVADFYFYRDKGQSNRILTEMEMQRMIRGVDDNFRGTDFNGDREQDNIGFLVTDIIVIESEKETFFEFDDSGRFADGLEYLKTFSAMWTYDEYCLAIAFTSLPFQPGNYVNAASSSHEQRGGICQPPNNTLAFTLSYFKETPTSPNASADFDANIVGLLDRDQAIVQLSFDLSLSFGGRPFYHDNLSENSREHEDFLKEFRLPACSLRRIRPVIVKKGTCLKVSKKNQCGNGVREQEEVCDCGPIKNCEKNDRHCNPNNADNVDIGCDVKQYTSGFSCTPMHNPCCNNKGQTLRDTNQVCKKDADCVEATTCDGSSSSCPQPIEKSNGTFCNSSTRVCESGVCGVSRCQKNGYQDCECIFPPSDRCKLCCKDNHSFCRPAHNYSIFDKDGGVIYLPLSSQCGGTVYCETILSDNPDSVWLLLFSNPLKWFRTYFAYIVLWSILFTMGFWTFAWAKMKYYDAHFKSVHIGKILAIFRIASDYDQNTMRGVALGRYLFERFEWKLKRQKQRMLYLEAVYRLRTLFPTCPLTHFTALVTMASNEAAVVRMLLSQGYPLRRFLPKQSSTQIQSGSKGKGATQDATSAKLLRLVAEGLDLPTQKRSQSSVSSGSRGFSASSYSGLALTQKELDILWAEECKQLLYDDSYSFFMEEFKKGLSQSRSDMRRVKSSRTSDMVYGLSSSDPETVAEQTEGEGADSSQVDHFTLAAFRDISKFAMHSEQTDTLWNIMKKAFFDKTESWKELPQLVTNSVSQLGKVSVPQDEERAAGVVPATPELRSANIQTLIPESLSVTGAGPKLRAKLRWARAARKFSAQGTRKAKKDEEDQKRSSYWKHVLSSHDARKSMQSLHRDSLDSRKTTFTVSATDDQPTTGYGLDFVDEHMTEEANLASLLARKKKKGKQGRKISQARKTAVPGARLDFSPSQPGSSNTNMLGTVINQDTSPIHSEALGSGERSGHRREALPQLQIPLSPELIQMALTRSTELDLEDSFSRG